MPLQHFDNARQEFLAPTHGGDVESSRKSLFDEGRIVAIRVIGKCFTNDVETSEDEDLPAADETFDIFASDEVTPSGADTRRITTQGFKVVPTTLKVVPDFSDRFLAYDDTGFSPSTCGGTRRRRIDCAASLRYRQSEGEVLSRHQISQGGPWLARFLGGVKGKVGRNG